MDKIEISVPDGTSGDWTVETFTVSEEDAKRDRLHGMLHGGRCVPAGTYKALKRNGSIIMSNTPDEISDCRGFIRAAAGSVLINGLGLGVVLAVILQKPEVMHITVIEKSADVIRLVAPTFAYEARRLEIINADAFEYKPPRGTRYDAVWHDIWDNICSDNIEEIKNLHRKYARRTKWQDSWCYFECMRYKRYGR